VGQFHVQHGGERGAENGDELARVCAVVRIHQMHRSQLESKGTKGQRKVRAGDESTCSLWGQSEQQLWDNLFRPDYNRSVKGQGQRPAPGEEQPQAPVQAGADLLKSSSAERDWECWGTTG